MSIVDLESFKAYVRNEAQGVDDPILQGYLDAASQALANTCGRQWVVAPGSATARTFQPRGCSRVLVIHDCTTITTVVDNGTTLTAGTDYQAEPLNNLSDAGETVPYYRLVKPRSDWYSSTGFASVVITAKWGWAAIPYQIVEACKALGKELVNNQDVRLGIAAVNDVLISGIRTNKVVRDAVDAYQHPNSIGVA